VIEMDARGGDQGPIAVDALQHKVQVEAELVSDAVPASVRLSTVKELQLQRVPHAFRNCYAIPLRR